MKEDLITAMINKNQRAELEARRKIDELKKEIQARVLQMEKNYLKNK
jgi:hypothetical protein